MLQEYKPLPFEKTIESEYWYVCGSVLQMNSKEKLPTLKAIYAQCMTTIQIDAKQLYIQQAILRNEHEKYNRTPSQFSKMVYANMDNFFDIPLPVTDVEMTQHIINYLNARYCVFEANGVIINNPYGSEVW